ncbi:hypothetical protein KCU91_g9781, partial [Aureobasidium melanogenum]
MADSSSTLGPSSSPIMAQKEKAADEATESSDSCIADQVSPPGSTIDVLAHRLGTIEEHLADIKKTLDKFEQTLEQTFKNMNEKMDKVFSDLCEEVRAFGNEYSRPSQSGDFSRSEPGAPPSSSVLLIPRRNFDKQAPSNSVPVGHPAYLFVVLAGSGSTRQFGYPAVGSEGGSFVTVRGLELARFDGDGEVFDMTPRDSFIGNFLEDVDV